MTSADLVVLGAGPAGVGAAYRTARAGHAVVVSERAAVPGGAAGSFSFGGVRVDLGSHRLHPSIDPRVLADLRALLGDGLERRERNGRIRLEGRWIAFPLRPTDLARNLPPRLAAGIARDLAARPSRRPADDGFAGALEAGLGPTLCRAFYFPYARKLWGLEPEDIDAEQARRRVAADSPLRLVARLVRGRSTPGWFWYPRNGYGAISEALAGAAARAGADLRFGNGATRVRLEAAGVEVTLEQGEALSAARLWSTIPLAALAAMSEPAPAPDVLQAARRLEVRSMVLVYLLLDRDRYTVFDAHYLPGEETPVTRISEPKNYRSGDDPRGRTALCAEIPCSFGDATWAATDAELGALVESTLVGAGLPVPPVQEVAVRRLRHAYPVYRKGFRGAFDALDEWADAQPRLLTFGRQGLFAHDNLHHALAMAWDAADALGPHGAFDAAAWAAARRRFADHVVED